MQTKHTGVDMRTHTLLDHLAIGKFAKPYGVKGELKFISYSGESSHLGTIHSISIQNFSTQFTVSHWILSSPIRCKLADIDTPEKAMAFSGLDVFVPRKLAAKLEDDEYYIADLYGLNITFNGKVMGTIQGIITDTYAPLFEITWVSGKSSFVPFIKKFFDKPSFKSSTINLLHQEFIEY